MVFTGVCQAYGGRWAWGTEAFSEPLDNRVTLTATSETAKDRGTVYSFKARLQTENGDEKESWQVTTPKIAPPAKDAAATR